MPGRSDHSVAKGYVHELGVYGTDDEFRKLILPFALGGLEDREPILLAYDPAKTSMLRRSLPKVPEITYVPTSPYTTPARALSAWRQTVEEHLAAGARRVRIAGDVPHPGHGQPYAGWDRYEAAVDRTLGGLPVWASCLYDARITPPDVLSMARRLHHDLLDGDGGRQGNEGFDPCGRLADFLAPPLDPLESTAPVFASVDPTPQAMRAAVRRAAEAEGLADDQQGDLVLATSEAVTNALLHGVPPIWARVWRGHDRVVVGVHDLGTGPTDPLAGLLPPQDGAYGGRGLWLTHQLDIDVALSVEGGGFAVRLSAGGRS